jgi:hypothetical protein
MKDNLWLDDGVDDLADVDVLAPRRAPDGAETEAERFIGCPRWWWDAVYPISRGKGELAVAIFLWRQRVVQGSRAVTVTNVCLMNEMGIGRHTKYRAIKNLEDAGLVTVRRLNKKAVEVTFCRRRRPPGPRRTS